MASNADPGTSGAQGVRTRFQADALKDFVARAVSAAGANAEDAALVADVLVASDLRGVESHGVARLEGFYIDRLRDGVIAPNARDSVVAEGPTSLAIDANNGLGHPVSVRTMERTIAKALKSGVAVATVRNSNHFGMAGYYAMQALRHDCIGIASTNAGRIAVPTGAREPMLGTNPFAFAIPAEDDDSFVLDMATTTVALGKLEIAQRLGKAIVPGWAVDEFGAITTDAIAGQRGALLPLGGFGTETGGHKGYGLALLCDMLCAVLGGGVAAPDMPPRTELLNSGICSHFFMAIKIENFRVPSEFKADVSRSLKAFREAPAVPGVERVFTAGEPELLRAKENAHNGIGLDQVVVASLDRIAEKLGIEQAQRLR